MPPLSAKASWRAMKGRVRTRSSTCRIYCSRAMRGLLRHEIIWNRDGVNRVKPAAWSERPVALTEIHLRHVDVLVPSIIVLVGVDKKQPLGFHAPAMRQQCRQQLWPEIGETLERHVDVVKSLVPWKLCDHFEDCAFGRRHGKAITIEQFVAEVDAYIRWYNEKRIKISLGSLSPVEYRKTLGLT